MTATIPNEGAELMLKNMLEQTTVNPPTFVTLYSNLVADGQMNVTNASFTPADSPQAIVPASWTITTVLDVTTATYATYTWNITGPITVYGYYVTTTDNKVCWYEPFSSEVVIPALTTTQIDVTLKIGAADHCI